MSNKSTAAAACCLLVGFGLATAQADTIVNPSTEYLKRIKVAETIEPLGETPFGESLSLFNGTVSFRQTDISFPGIGPTITLARSYDASGSGSAVGYFGPTGDWSLSIPRISTIVPGTMSGRTGSWTVSGPTPTARCSQIGPIVNPHEYGLAWWHGYQLITQDGTSQPLLKRGPANPLAPGNDTAKYSIVTPSHWMLSCLPSTSNGMPGEAFLALAPDGTKYWFDHLVYGSAEDTLLEELPEQGPPGGGPGIATGAGDLAVAPGDTSDIYNGVHVLMMTRRRADMFATRVEDRFGNWIAYNYNAAGQLTEINASDLRKVQLTWSGSLVSAITVQPASAKARTWTYHYSDGVLVRVVQPDLSEWKFAMAGAGLFKLTSPFAPGVCGIRSAGQFSGTEMTMSLTHPSGLAGQFVLGERMHGRANVPTGCNPPNAEPVPEAIPPIYMSLSLVNKTLSGPGLATASWSFDYSPVYGSTVAECAAGAQCRDWKWTEMTDPLGQTTHYTFNTRWGHTEGKLLSTVSGVTQPGQDNPAGLQSNVSGYASPNQGPYPSSLGTLLVDSYAPSNNATSETLSPENLQQTLRQGVTFTRQTHRFDRFGQAEHVSRYSSLGDDVTEITGHLPVTGEWVLGQVEWLIDGESWRQVTRTEYNAQLLPARTYSFGLLVGSYAYNANGTLSTITDPRGNITRLSQYYRGIPQNILFADNTVLAPAADEFGQIASVKNQLGDSTSYLYDGLGRMTRMNLPTNDTAAWNPAIRSFTPVAANEYGLSIGHWKQITQTGGGRTTTFYDAFWRPRVVCTEDAGNVATKSFVVHRYDVLGREIFRSYPVATLGTVDDSLQGVRTTYDALGRVVQVQQDSELGPLSTSTEYLAGFKTRVTNPRNFATTTSYQVFDAPSEKSPIRIDAPEGATTVIVRDDFGKPKTITRSGPAG